MGHIALAEVGARIWGWGPLELCLFLSSSEVPREVELVYEVPAVCCQASSSLGV